MDELRQIYFHEAMIQYIQKDPKRAQRLLQTFVLLNGSKPKEGYHSPEFVGLYKDAVASVRKRPVCVLEVRVCTHAGIPATVFVDGKPMGESPLRLNHLRVGSHYIEVRAPGHVPFGSLIQLKAAGKILEPSLEMVTIPFLAAEILDAANPSKRARLLRLAEEKTNTQSVLIFGDRQLLLLRGGQPIWSKALSVGQELFKPEAKTIRTALSSLKPNSTLASVMDSHKATQQQLASASAKKGSAWYKKWWVWTLVGAAAAGGGAFFLFGNGGGGSDPTSVHLTVRGE